MREARKNLVYPALYALAVILMIVPLFDLFATMWPLQPSVMRWRFGAIGYLGSNLVLPVAGVTIAFVTATVMEHRRALRALSVLGLVGALVLFAFSGLLVVDGMQLREATNPEILRTFTVSMARSFVSLGLSSLLMLWLGIAGWRASEPSSREKKPSTISPVVGAS